MAVTQVRRQVVGDDDALQDVLVRVVAAIHKQTDGKIAALEAKLNALQSAMAQFKFVGQWREGMQCRAGNFITTGGQVWHCNADTTSRPGTDSSFTLAVKSGRDGRDGRDFTPPPPSPGGPRETRSSRV
jgi:hypothetical protein